MTRRSGGLRRTSCWGVLLGLLALPLAAQTAQMRQTARAPQTYSDALGFSYSLPAGWEVVVPQTSPPTEKPKTTETTPEEVKKGIACIEVPLTARHGTPQSAIVIVALPFACFGQTMTPQELGGFGEGVTEGLKTTFDFLNPVSATYRLSGHRVWMERIKAVPKGKTTPVMTVEVACTILEKGAVCWTVEAADMDGLDAFEKGEVTLEGSAARRLVPADLFQRTH